jgi:PAS domain S-box-containing protein
VILLIHEDQPNAAETITTSLNQAGIISDWVCAATKQEIQEHLSRDVDLALVFSDNSPQDTCLTLVSSFHENGRAIPYIVISQITDPETVVACIKMGASDYLPASQLNRLPNAIQQALHKTTGTHEITLMKSLFNQVPTGLCITDAQGNFILVNKAYASLFSYEVDELIGKHFSIIVPPELLETCLQDHQNILLGRVSAPIMRTCVRKDSSTINILAKSTVSTGEDGKKVIVTSVQDVSNQVAMETALRQSEERFSKIFRNCPAPVTITTLADGHYLDANDEFLKLTGYSRENLLELTSVDVGIWASPESRMIWKKELIKQRKLTYREEIFHLPTGQDVHVILSDELIETGGRECILTVYSNVTELKRAEITLQKNEKALELRANQLSLINDIGRQISRVLEVDRLLATAAVQIHERFGYHHVAIYILDPESSDLVLKASQGGFLDQLEKNYRQKIGTGMVGWSAQNGKTLLANDVRVSPQYLPRETIGEQTQAELCVPISVAGKVLGILDVQSPALYAFDESDLLVMETLANQLAGALENAHLVEEIRCELAERLRVEEQMNKQVHRLAALRDIDLAITASLDLHITLQIILDKISSQLNIDAVAIFLLTPHTQMLEYAAGQGFRKSIQKQMRLNLGDSLAGRTVRERTVVVAHDLAQTLKQYSQNPAAVGEGFVTYYGVPLITKGMVKGVLEIYQRSPLPSDPDWLGFLEALATQAALAIDDARLFEDLQRSNAELSLAYDTTLEGLSRTLDMRDQDTEGHSRRVTDLTIALAQAMGISGEELTHIYRGSLLHDIGKMGIPDNILLKPGPLTPEEWAIMRTHPQNAYNLLAPISHLRGALEIPYCHHEKWNGTGYPRGLRGEEIPLSARIFAVVDAWDALNSDRPYRKAWSKENAFDYILQESGISYDTAVVEQFAQLIRSGKESPGR